MPDTLDTLDTLDTVLPLLPWAATFDATVQMGCIAYDEDGERRCKTHTRDYEVCQRDAQRRADLLAVAKDLRKRAHGARLYIPDRWRGIRQESIAAALLELADAYEAMLAPERTEAERMNASWWEAKVHPSREGPEPRPDGAR